MAFKGKEHLEGIGRRKDVRRFIYMKEQVLMRSVMNRWYLIAQQDEGNRRMRRNQEKGMVRTVWEGWVGVAARQRSLREKVVKRLQSVCLSDPWFHFRVWKRCVVVCVMSVCVVYGGSAWWV
jgi:hypothetical protein